ncbi:phytanoyl-CoA dioxygenase family protein [Candidatus Pelagibacter sp.]|nr:phytanoyl-CoA dioxygenase family protein [Candidatus Pelagibacter sp.]
MKNFLKKHISHSLRTRLEYMRHDLLNSPLSSAWKILRHRQNLLVRHASWFDDLKTQGYTIVHNYLSKEQCKKAVIELKTAFESYPAFVHKKEDKRIFGIEQILPAARLLAHDINFLELGELVNREQTYCAFTLGNWLESGKSGSSGDGWHRDAFHSQYKALLYLTDVSEDNGPFELLPGSHHLASVLAGIEKAGLHYMQDRFSDAEVSCLEEVLETPRQPLTGDAGTLVLFNSSSVHRGRPIQLGERLALTNYYYSISNDIRNVRNHFSPVVIPTDVY